MRKPGFDASIGVSVDVLELSIAVGVLFDLDGFDWRFFMPGTFRIHVHHTLKYTFLFNQPE